MKNQQNHLKKVSIIHMNNTENNPEMKIYSLNKRNTLTNPLNNNRTNIVINQYNTINDTNRISKRIYRPKLNSNTDIIANNNIYKGENVSNRNQHNKIHLISNSDCKLPSFNYIVSDFNNNSKKTIDSNHPSNSNFHIINQNQNKRNIETEPNKEINKIYKNHSTTFISGLSKQSQEKNENRNKNNNKKGQITNININNRLKNMPKLSLTKLKDISKDFRKKAETSRPILLKSNLEEINNKKNLNLNIEKEENKVKFSRRLEITEKTEVLLPNQTFKPFEQFEKKEKPIIEIKKNKDGTNMKIVKEILIKTKIENSLIEVPKVHLVKDAPQVTLIKKKITNEYITTIKFYSNIIDFNENANVSNTIVNNKMEAQRKVNNSNHELIEIKPDTQINAKNGQNTINHEKEFKTSNEPLTNIGTNGNDKINNIYKSTINERNKRNIKNTVYSNVINNNINKEHKRNNNSNKNTNIDNMIRKNIQNKNYHIISNIHRKNKYNIGNGNNGININLQENNNRNSKNNNIKMTENSNIKKNINNNLLTAKEINNFQMMSNESQIISNIYNVNGSLNSFSISDSKVSSKVLFDFPFNLDFEKNESEKLEEKEKIIFNEKGKKEKTEKKEDKKIMNTSETKFEKLNEFIIKFNDEKNKPDSDNNNPNGEKNNSDENQSPLMDKQSEEKVLSQMQLSNLNLALKDDEENENEDNYANCGENANNFDKRDLTGSIIFINSNIDKNIHIQNGLENHSMNMDGNSIIENFNIIEGENISPNNDKEFIDKLQLIKNKINDEIKDEEFIENNNTDEKGEEIENDEKFFRPLNKYENKFNLDQINPF